MNQWLFRKIGTMGTLASQAEIGVWVQAPGAPPRTAFCHAGVVVGKGHALWVSPPEKDSEIVYAKSCNLVHFWPENGSQCRP